MKLTKNEKDVLKLLLENGRIPDVSMAKKLKISTQTVGKIRKKLENSNVIVDYACNLNFEKLGLNIFALVLMKIKDKFWNDIKEIKSRDTIKKIPEAIFSCMPSSSDISIIELHAFRDSKEMDRYFYLKRIRQHEYFEIINIYPFSNLNFLKNNPKELFKLILEDKSIVPLQFKQNAKKNLILLTPLFPLNFFFSCTF